MARTTVVMYPPGVAKVHLKAGQVLKDVVDQIERDAKRRVPVDSGELRDSIHSVISGEEGRVIVGTDHWAATEFGSGPHLIRSTGAWPLRSRETGQVFGPVVHHPGTPSQPFMRPAVFQARRLM